MAEIVLDLSGMAGLADLHHGDMDVITPLPNLRLAKQTSDLVQGLFNPYRRQGYLSPVTTTNVDLTVDVATTTQLASVEYDYLNDDIYWANRGNQIYRGDGLSDTSLVEQYEVKDSILDLQTWDRIYDLQMYQLNGVQKLFFVGEGVPLTDLSMYGVTFAVEDGTPVTYRAVSTAVVPAVDGVKPVIAQSNQFLESGPVASETNSITVPSGSNKVLLVIVYWTGNTVNPTATFNGVTLDVEGTFFAGGAILARVFKLVNPTSTTANLVLTWSSGNSSNISIRAMTITGANQIDPVHTNDGTGTSVDDLTVDIEPIVNDSLKLIECRSTEGTLSTADTDELDFDANAGVLGTYDFVSQYEWTADTNIYGLQVGYADLPFSSSNAKSAWLWSQTQGATQQVLNSGYAFMRTADNGFAYIFADYRVHKVDGTTTGGANGTVTRDVLLFPEWFTITDAVDYRSRLYIAINQNRVNTADTDLKTFSGRTGIYVWNRISTQLGGADFIELPGVREIKRIFASPDGQLKLITISDNGLTELRQFGYNDSGGVVFPVVKTLGVGAYPQFPDGLTTAGDKVVWVANDGKLYANKENSVTQIYQTKAPGTTTATLESNITTGAILYGSGDETGDSGFRSNKQAVTFSYLDGSTVNIEKVYPFDLKTGANATQTPAQGDVYTGVTLLPLKSILRQVRVYNAPIAGSGSTVIATVKLYFNQSSTASMTKTITKDEAKRGYVDFHINKPYIHAIQLEIEWSTSITLDGDVYLPSNAIISYDETRAKSPDNG